LLGLRNHVLAWTYLKNVDQGSWPRESGIAFLILKILMNASKRGAAEKWINKIVAGSHPHFFYYHNVLCFMPLRKLWERHLAAIKERFESSRSAQCEKL
jgi:hypothetical protein